VRRQTRRDLWGARAGWTVQIWQWRDHLHPPPPSFLLFWFLLFGFKMFGTGSKRKKPGRPEGFDGPPVQIPAEDDGLDPNLSKKDCLFQ